MRIVFFASLIFLTACNGIRHAAEIQHEADEKRVLMMRSESDVYGDFFLLRIFHNDLMQVTMEPGRAPYPALDSLFAQLRDQADAVIVSRMKYDSVYKEVKQLTDQKRPKHTPENNALLQRYDAVKLELPTVQAAASAKYFETRHRYDRLKTSEGIVRLGMTELAVLTGEKVILWLDSLEEIGKMIGREKQDLKLRFPEQKGKNYMTAYQPVSLLEAKMKDMESMLAQLQNSQSRFEEGNKQDFIYFGPFIRPRMEMQATDNVVSALALGMTECRKLEAEYWNNR